MLKKLSLYHSIKKFYAVFGSELGSDFIHNLSDITDDNLHDVLFDLNEVIDEDYPDRWLIKLQTRIINYLERPRHSYAVAITIILVVLALVGGYTIGRQHTIRQASLYDIAEDEYYISFGDEIHTYTKGE